MLILFFVFLPAIINSQVTDNVITKWKLSYRTGYCDIKSDVIAVHYDCDYAYVSTNYVPSYGIGPWYLNSNKPRAKEDTYKFLRKPTREIKRKTKVSSSRPIGLFINGQAIFSPFGKKSYMDLGVWRKDAYLNEKKQLDCCNGNVDKSGIYYSRSNPVCLYDTNVTCNHSPLLGYAFDSFPIYGPFAYSNPLDPKSPIKRMMSSYKKREIFKRKSLAGNEKLKWIFHGPDVCPAYPLGTFVQDYEYVCNLGDLDEFNGRYCVTPEYPHGTYAYFITTDNYGYPAFPYILGPYYYGVVKSKKPVNISYKAVKFF